MNSHDTDVAVDAVGAELRSAVGSFEANAEWLADEKDLDRLAVLFAALREAKDALTAIERDISPVIADLMGRQQVQVGDLKLERRGGKDRKRWQSEELFSELIRMSNIDDAGVQMTPGESRECLIRLIRDCFPLTGSTGWRATALRKWGIDPDEWCESSPAPYRVEVHKVTDEGAEL